MALLDLQGQGIEAPWVELADDAPLEGAGHAVISQARLLRERDALDARNAPLGVRLGSDAKPEAIADLLDRLGLVVIEFPKFRDGRGFTIARTLRERYGFTGEIRAAGHILPDQYSFLLQSGFSQFDVPDTQPVQRWGQAAERHAARNLIPEPATPLLRRIALGS